MSQGRKDRPDHPAEVAAMSAAPIVDNQASRSAIILVVEDEVLIRMMMATELRAAGFAVLEAANADEALKVLRSSEPVDLMVTDIRMPGTMDGIRLAASVRGMWESIKIIIASAHTPEWPVAVICDAFIGKPFTPDRLIERVRQVLKGGAP